MTEQEWLESGDWLALWFYSSEIGLRTERKTRLFAAAACRRFVHRVLDNRSFRALEICERFADGIATENELEKACDEACDASDEVTDQTRSAIGQEAASAVRWLCYSAYKVGRATEGAPHVHGWEAAIRAGLLAFFELPENPELIQKHSIYLNGVTIGERIQADILREVIGNPFRAVLLNPEWLAWNDGTIRRIAQAIYNERAFDRLPILADALEDAGCDNTDILTHCRSGGEHVRGCWVVDLLLGKQ